MSTLPVLIAQPVEGAPTGTPQITEIHYDVWSLRITLDFDDWNGVVYVDFENPTGFRVLDESDLEEMWENNNDDAIWLHVVDENGWLEQESARTGFTQDEEDIVEYLVSGANDCISVFASDEPTITVIGAED